MRYVKRIDAGKSWEFVCIAAPTGDPDNKVAVLKPDSGEPITVPINDLNAQYSLQSGDASATVEAIKETLANIRQNSNLRFIALPFFITASAVMANAYMATPWSHETMLPWFGLGLASVGLFFEIILSRNLTVWWQALLDNKPPAQWNTIFAHRGGVAVRVAGIALLVPYPAMVFYWLSKEVSVPWAGGIAVFCLVSGVIALERASPAKVRAPA